jgi:hypothetical protein
MLKQQPHPKSKDPPEPSIKIEAQSQSRLEADSHQTSLLPAGFRF